MPTEITRPTANSQLSAPTGDGMWTNNTLYNCYDYQGPTPPDTSTTGDIWAVTSVGVESAGSWQFTGCQSATKTYNSNVVIKLNVIGCTIPDGGSFIIYYWNGSSWGGGYTINSSSFSGVVSFTTSSSSLPSGCKVRVDYYHPAAASQTDNTLSISDIWAEGTYSAASNGKKSATASSF